MLTNALRSTRSQAAVEIMDGLDALVESFSYEMWCFVENLRSSINWEWWTTGQRVADIDAAFADAADAWAQAWRTKRHNPSPGATEDEAEAARRYRDCDVFRLNTWRIERLNNKYAARWVLSEKLYHECRHHAEQMAGMAYCKDARWDVWDEHAITHFTDFLVYEDDAAAWQAWRDEVESYHLQ